MSSHRLQIRALVLAFLGLACAAAWAGENSTAVRDVKDFGAIGDGTAAETGILQGAIDACAVAGGCVLRFPPGRYVSGTLFLRDNVTLDLAPGAVIETSKTAADYPAPALFYGKGLDNIGITGAGEVQAGPVPAPDERTTQNPGSRLLSIVLIENSTNVHIRNVRFRRSPTWTVTLRVVDSAWIENVAIDTAMQAANTSGIVLDSSSRVFVRGLNFRGGGDGITMQTSLVDGVAPPCEHITISDSSLRSGAMAIKVGTTTHGDIRNLVVENSVIEGSQGGVGIFVRDGGTVESLQFANLVISTSAVRRGSAEWPIVLDLKRRDENSPAGALGEISFVNTQVRSSGKILLSGMVGHPIRSFRMQGLTFTAMSPMQEITAPARPWKSPVDNVTGEDQMGTAILVGYVAGATLENVRVTWNREEPAPERHALFVHSTDGLTLDGFNARQAQVRGNLAALQFLSSRNIEIRNSTAPPQTGIWLQAHAMTKQDIFLSGNNLNAADREVVFVK